MPWSDLRRLPISPQLVTFLAVGGTGYVVDVAVFNLLRSTAAFASLDPSVARVVAVAVAMVVTYLGNSLLTWRGSGGEDRRRDVMLFVVFNLIGLGLSVLTLTVSHDVLGLTSRLADNISANVVGLALGTMFRYWSYKTFVFAPTGSAATVPDQTTEATTGEAGVPPSERSRGSGRAMRLSSATSAVLLIALVALSGGRSEAAPSPGSNGSSTKVVEAPADADDQPVPTRAFSASTATTPPGARRAIGTSS